MQLPSNKVTSSAGSVVVLGIARYIAERAGLSLDDSLEDIIMAVFVMIVGYWVKETRPSASAVEAVRSQS